MRLTNTLEWCVCSFRGKGEHMSAELDKDALRKELFGVVSEITGINLSDGRADAESDFTETGVSSVEYLEIVDRVERRFGVEIDLESNDVPTSAASFMDFLVRKGASM
jgi:acyl carrier protein